MSLEPATREARHPLFRVARSADPLKPSMINPSDATHPRAGNRFDVVGGAVLYFASDPMGCYLETLARFRPSARLQVLLRDEPGFMAAGQVPADWRHKRLLISADCENPLPFLDIEHPSTHAFLDVELAQELTALGVDNLDVAGVRGPNRLITRALAQYAYNATDEDGAALYSGIRYVSKIGDFECWAVFEGTVVHLTEQSVILATDTELLKAAAQLCIRVH